MMRRVEKPAESGSPTGIDMFRNWRVSDGWGYREARRYCIKASAGRSSARIRRDDCRGGVQCRRCSAYVLPMTKAAWWDAGGTACPVKRTGERIPAAGAGGIGPDTGRAHPGRGGEAKLPSASRRRKCIDHVLQELGVSERRACRTLGQHRSTQLKVPQGRADQDRLTGYIIELVDLYGRYRYRMVTGLLKRAGWHLNHKLVEPIW